METEDKSMKFTNTIILANSFLLLFSLSGADEKSVEKGHFSNINPNIKNEELHSELTILMENFGTEKQKIQDYYEKKIEKLKEERRLEVQAVKKKFGEKREILFNKYGEDRKLIQSKPYQINLPDKKMGKDKKSRKNRRN
jgi:hypothetical protein